MLTLLLIITLTNFKIIGGVEDDTEFINSLPEKQKKEFIKTVEKRIQNEVPEVKFPEGNDTNVDLYEKRLEDQSKSIQNIMRLEINNVKNQQLRRGNNTLRQSAHIDLTLRTRPEEHTNKSILFEKIPVAVQYDGENIGDGKSSPNIKNVSKSDSKIVDVNNTSAERKRNGRRSNDFEFENVTLADRDVNNNTEAVDDTEIVKINTRAQDVETTKDAVDSPVTRPPTTQEVTFETTRQEVSTQTDEEKSRTVQGSDPNNTISDKPKYVPVYNYDPENAYFNPNTGRPWNGDVIDKKVGSSKPVVIKKTVTHSESTKLDIYANGNEKSLRIKDIKQRIISASNNKIKQNPDLYEIVSDDESAESSNDDVFYEKPLKHTLKKIREKIYKHQVNDKSKDIKSDTNSQSKNEVRKKYNAISDNNEEQDIANIFKNFGTLLQKLVDHADNNEEISSENKKDSNEDVRSSDTDIYRDVAHSLESHNRFIKNKGIQKIVEELEKIQNNIHNKRKKKIGKHSHQSRFQVIDRDEKEKHNEVKIYRIIDHFDKPRIRDEDELEYENVQFEKAKPIKIEDDYLELHANIVKDLVETNDEGLKNYDWLGTTVLIQAGLAKLRDITEKKLLGEELDPLDEDILEFLMTLHKEALQILAKQQNERTMPTKRKRLSFRIPKPKNGRNFNALNRIYGEISKTKVFSLIRSGYNIEDFREFLIRIRNCLNDLHTAIRQISFITTYEKQRWFKNLKQLYLNDAGEREYLELLLHFVSARLIGLLDERVRKATREDSDFMSGDREAERIEVEFVMTLKICNELSRLKD